jgi:hypothetical protein
MKLEVTQRDILTGEPQDRCGCAFALALSRAIPNLRVASIFPQHAFLEFLDGNSFAIALPPDVKKFVAAFDAVTLPEKKPRVDPRMKFKPFVTEIDLTAVAYDPFTSHASAALSNGSPSSKAQPRAFGPELEDAAEPAPAMADDPTALSLF